MSSRRWSLAGISAWLLCSAALATDRDLPFNSHDAKTTIVSPLQDDSNLHAVRFVGTQYGWAVGDRGVIWHTRDGGSTWELQSSGVDCPLRGISFLTDKVGWIAGGDIVPFTQLSRGILLATTDGGATWRRITPATPGDQLPRLHGVKFFSREHGIVVGQATDAHRTGILLTQDGGRTWRDVPGAAADGWHVADFLNPDAGVVAGSRGAVGRLADGQYVPSRLGNLGTRGLHGVVLQPNGGGWLVGDGGLILNTENSGLVWQAPTMQLPESLRDTFDFHAVTARGEKVWIAGQPGSVVWYSPDSGSSWQKQLTQQSLPLAGIAFASDQIGCAVGALGTILRTENGGRSWQAVRGGGRRLALYSLHARSRQTPLSVVTRIAGDQGYRTHVEILAREDIGSDGAAAADLEAQLDAAVSIAGGSASHIAWQFPLGVPGLDRNTEKLLADWNRRMEQQLENILLGHLVGQFRMWRPSVLVLDQPAADDALGQLVNRAAREAVDQAADATRFLNQRDFGGLEPWRVSKVFLRLPPGSTGTVNIDPYEYLPRCGQTVQTASATAQGVLFGRMDARPNRDAYRLWSREAEPSTASGGDFFAGLSLFPGGPARRELPAIDADRMDSLRQVAERQRNFNAMIDRYLTDTRFAGQLIAQLSEAVRNMPATQAAQQLSQLAESYRARGEWELAETALLQLVESYPNDPVAQRALQSLVQSWSSAEVTWRRVKKTAVAGQKVKVDPRITLDRIEQASAKLQQLAQQTEAGGTVPLVPGGTVITADGSPLATDARLKNQQVDEAFRFWQGRAQQAVQDLERRSPALFAAPEVQFPLAALYRSKADPRGADELYRRQAARSGTSNWSKAAAAELWLSQPVELPVKEMIVCRRAAERPVLDGVLSDPCWQLADELPLTAGQGERIQKMAHPFAMLCRDDEYLYFAASLPRMKGTRTDGPTQTPRRHDEDLQSFDRVNLFLDVDRDYVTFYNFAVDQRGCTAESCWHDAGWNPRWLVWVDADVTHWRVEAAIPLTELLPRTPSKNSVWNVGIVRTNPAVSLQSWTHPAASSPGPDAFGWVRFE